MLKDGRIKEAESNFPGYIERGLILKQEFEDKIFNTLMRNSIESFDVAEHLFISSMSNLWVIVTSYYSMFYIANAVLFKMGYKVGDKIAHKVTADALIVLARGKLKESILEGYDKASIDALELSDNLLESFDMERGKRSRIQYTTTEEVKRAKAQTSLARAKEFSSEMKKLLLRL